MRKPEDYRKIIFGMSKKFISSFTRVDKSIELGDLIGEGYLCFIELLSQERKQGLTCAFEVALSNQVKQKFIYLLQKKKCQKRFAETIGFEEVKELIGRNPWKKIDDYINLSGEAKEVVEILWFGPKELMDLLKIEDFKTAISKYLKRHRGWKTQAINKFWNDLGKNPVVDIEGDKKA